MRKLSTLALEVVANGAAGVAGAAPLSSAAAASDELDLSAGSRDFLTRESAEELLAPMLAPGSKVRRIRFSTKSFGVEAAHVAARAIENVAATLEDADMSDIIAGRPGGALVEAAHGTSPLSARVCCVRVFWTLRWLLASITASILLLVKPASQLAADSMCCWRPCCAIDLLQRTRLWRRCESSLLRWAGLACATSTSVTTRWGRRAFAPALPPSASRWGGGGEAGSRRGAFLKGDSAPAGEGMDVTARGRGAGSSTPIYPQRCSPPPKPTSLASLPRSPPWRASPSRTLAARCTAVRRWMS